MSGIIANLLTVAKKINHYIVDATDIAAGNLKFDSDTVATFTVPANKRWILLGGYIKRDVNAATRVVVKDTADKIILHLMYDSTAGIGELAYPGGASQTFHGRWPFLIILDAGEYVHINYGVAQTGASTATCVVLEVDI